MLVCPMRKALNGSAVATAFSSLYVAIAYYSILITPSNVEITAFITHVILYKIVKMPSGFAKSDQHINN